ncbi:hypothetical protein FB451DRAFT_1287883 [Mycena latifolia]|nr:hypothetical protein FB451DRAFT_1287883 [Mycena latifolia]
MVYLKTSYRTPNLKRFVRVLCFWSFSAGAGVLGPRKLRQGPFVQRASANVAVTVDSLQRAQEGRAERFQT